jgi:hypothetical protein
MSATADRLVLTDDQRRAVRFLNTQRRLGNALTVEDLGFATGLQSSVTVLATALAQKGYITHPGL